MTKKDKIIFCIPGGWADRADFLTELARHSDGAWLASGQVIFETASGMSCEFGFFPHAGGLAEDFRSRSVLNPMAEDELAEIENYRSFVCLYSKDAGPEVLLFLSRVAAELVGADMGGVAVGIEGSRRAFSQRQWLERIEDASGLPELLYQTCVWTFVSGSKGYCSIGMTFLGVKDICIEVDDLAIAETVFHEFAQYLLLQNPKISNGHTISFASIPGGWRIEAIKHIYCDDPDIDFSGGMWHLSAVDN